MPREGDRDKADKAVHLLPVLAHTTTTTPSPTTTLSTVRPALEGPVPNPACLPLGIPQLQDLLLSLPLGRPSEPCLLRPARAAVAVAVHLPLTTDIPSYPAEHHTPAHVIAHHSQTGLYQMRHPRRITKTARLSDISAYLLQRTLGIPKLGREGS